MKMKFTIVYFIIFTLCSCQELFWLKDEELSIERKDYTGDAIRLDGYYFRIIENTTYGEPYGNPYFFYRNGIVLDAGGFPLNDQINYDQDIIEMKYEETYRSAKRNWGVFEIIVDTIRFEKWYSSSGGGLPVYIREGIILNDTSFHITKSYKSIEGKIEELAEEDETYYFHRLEYKPDSTNTFIE